MEELVQTKDFLQDISDLWHSFVIDNVANGWQSISLVVGKFLIFVAIIYLIDTIFKFLLYFSFKYFVDEERFPMLVAIQKSKITNSIAHLIALIFGKFAFASIFYTRPSAYLYLDKLVDIGVVIVIAGMTFRFLKALEYYYLTKKDFYRIVALRAVSQTIKIFGLFIFSIIAISIIFGIKSGTILGSLGAITAVLVLVFRDTILGFVTGLHVATSRNLKVGDWIGIPKYNLEGFIEDINLLTTKILCFDKTISTIPTYDLLSTEIKNLQVMSETNTRRIKRSIVFNINSFQFVDKILFEKLSHLNLLKEYMEEKRPDIFPENQDSTVNMNIMNGEQLTNIGLFRIYALNYIKNNKHIDQTGDMMVRQMESTPQGLPLEIYCFTNDSVWQNYEAIQSDIFDHLLVASKEFKLEVVQLSKA
ncbi:mechanosensitive ion channel family protein [Frigoriflavimonas asaccharolytica]|uniref:Miniconductance mechanosensitive channel n=1 Tax=Frigoriflavimonas asaccharolytica TaxID=2735899 RepID=A0A8J8G8T1_9FLAO|nr:mechanosensitive ion channel domain-containing protein [Frigoriflavimonas asaccharolytica]NRS93203.1 miniconductance mechanosensitive channel [Frigoriflavimonas asaccharolytica]